MKISLSGILICVFSPMLPTKSFIFAQLQNLDNHELQGKSSFNRISQLSKTEVDWSLNTLNQEDPNLIKVLKDYYLSFPTDLIRNLSNFRVDKKEAYGQFGQASIVDKYYNHSKRNGFFIEAGAYDGELFSNTLFLEVIRGWTGLLVEANPDNFEQLLSRNRNVSAIETCLSRQKFPEIVNFDAASIFGGILVEGRPQPGENIPITDRERIKPIVDETRRTIRIQCFPISSLVLALGNPVIDYLSLDIEGAELEVLKTIPFDKIKIQLISVEIARKKLNENAAGEHYDPYDDIVSLMKHNGYSRTISIPHTSELLVFEVFFERNNCLNV